MIHLAMLSIEKEIVFRDEILAFLSYEEMGIQQGYVLIPLVLFVSFQQYKMEFLMRAKYKTSTVKTVWRKHIHALLVLMGFTGIGLGLEQFVEIPELVFVIAIILISSIYKLKFAD